MSNTNKQTPKDNGHQDCDDCKRQKRQNAALIGIYQRLQAVRNKTTKVNSDIANHMRRSFQNFQNFQLMKDKVKNKPIQQQFNHQINTIAMSLVGDIFQQQLKAKTERQNLSLKQMITSMQKQRIKKKSSLNKSIQLKNQVKAVIKMRQPRLWSNSVAQVPLTKSIHIDENEKNSTNSTSFNIRQSKEKSSNQYYENLKGLWLYQNQLNNKLEQEFLNPRKKISQTIRLPRTQVKPSVLPALNRRQKKQY